MSAQEEVVIISVMIQRPGGKEGVGEKKGKQKAHSGFFFYLEIWWVFKKGEEKKVAGTKQEMRRGRMK